jgi:hypothetical protein
MVIGATTTEHSGMRFEITTWRMRVEAKCHVSEMEVHVNHFVYNRLGNVK